MIKILAKSKELLASAEFISIIAFSYSSKLIFKAQNQNKKPYKSQSSYQNQSIKPQSSNKIKLNNFDDSKCRLSLEELKQIEDFNKISHSLQFLRTPYLALFLKKLYPYLNIKIIQQNEQLFERIQNRLKSFSETMNIQMQQMIQILKFHCKFRSIKKDFDFYHNFGFEKYASMTASNFIYNRKFNINQAIFAFSSLVPLGDSHLNLFINFLKYFKTIASEQPQLLKLQHYLTILNTKFAKRNDIILENTSYDHVLHQLLKNLQQVLKGVSITFKTETLCTLLKIDNRISYQTDPQKHIKQTISLMRQLANRIQVDWFSKSWLSDQQQTQDELSMINVVHILDCMLFVRNNMINYQNYSQQINAFCQKSYISMQSYLISLFTNPSNIVISQKSINLLIRFSLNPLILPFWIADDTIYTVFYSILTKFHIKNEDTFLPLAKAIDQFSDQKQIFQSLLKICVEVAKQNLHRNIILKDLIIICIQNRLEMNIFSEYFIGLNKEGSKHLVFAIFLEKLSGQKGLFHSLKDINISKESSALFINDLYKATLSSRTIEGYTKALQILKQHYSVINRLIQPLQNSDNKKSERNQYLSRESLQFSYIIFINILNGIYIPQNIQKLFNRIIINNILIYHILKKLFRQDYPLPNLVQRPRFFGDFTTVFRNMLNFFQSMDKYNYFVWDSMLKLYSTQPLHIRQRSFPLIEQCFLRTIRKSKARKVILTMTMMRFIASGVIIGPRPKLQQLFQLTIDDLLSSEQNKAFYYKCYVQIIFSAFAADVLTPIYFDKIIADSLKRDQNLKHTSVIMLIYGASLKGRNLVGGVIDPTIISMQQAYIQRLIRQKTIKPATQKSTRSFTIALNNQVICYLFSFGTISIIQMDSIIYEYIQNCKDFSKWRSMVNCYTPENYNMYFKEQAKFRGKINKIFIEKLIYFKSLKMVSEKEESYFVDKFK